MKITIIMPSFDNGGVQSLMSIIVKGLIEKGNDITIITGNANGDMQQSFNSAKIIDLKREERGDYKLLFAQKEINKITKDQNPDVILAVPGYSTIAAIKAANKNKLKVAIMVDNKLSLLKKGRIKHIISYNLYKHYYRKADIIITAHKNAENDIIKNYNIRKQKVKTIYYPLIDIKSISKIKAIKHKWNSDKYTLVFSAGRLCEEKDFPTLIKAFKTARAVNDKLRLIIAGDGEEREKLISLIEKAGLQDTIELPGHVDNVIGYMKASDIFVLPSKKEAFGIVLIEALSCGIPVVSSDTESGAQKELLKNSEIGILFKPGDIKALSNILADQNTYKNNVKRQIEKANEFDYEKSINEYNSVLRSIV